MRRAYRQREAAQAWQLRKAYEMQQLLRFEQTFFRLKDASEDYVPIEVLRVFLSYAAMDQPVAARAAALRRLSSDHAIDRAAFVRCCVELCMHLPPDTLDLAISAFRATVDTLESRQTEQCVERAHKVDQFAKCVLPTAFVTFLLVIFGITFTDSYIEGDDGSVKMFAGFGHVESWASWSILASIFFPLGVAFVVYGSSYVVSGLNKRSVTQRVLALQETTKGFMVRESSRDDSD